MRYRTRRLLSLLCLPFLHLLLCVTTLSGRLYEEGSWTWFLLFWLDFPFSIVMLPLIQYVHRGLVFGILGTLWWFVLNLIIEYVFTSLKRRLIGRRW